MLIKPKPTPSFTVNISEGCAPLKITVTNNSTAAVYSWNMGDGTVYTTSAPSFEHTYQNLSPNTINPEITLNVESASGCTNSLKRSVRVHPQVIAALSTFDTMGCSPYPSKMIDISTNAQLYDWSLNNGAVVSVEKNPLFNFINNTLADSLITIKLVASSSNCTDTTYRIVRVHGKPVADFELDKLDGCGPLGVQITNKSLGASTYSWDLDDSTTTDTSVATFDIPSEIHSMQIRYTTLN
jgi:PKD repeat protein